MSTAPVSSVPATPDVLIVGAGLFGLATAFHLARAGKTVTVVDSGTAASGTTAAGAGFVGLWAAGYAWYWNRSELALEQYGIDFYRELAQTADITLRETGNVWLSTTEQGYRDHILPFETHRLRPEGARLLDPAEAAELVPGLDATAVTGGFFHPLGIQISAPDAGLALAEAARAAGATIIENTPIAAVESTDGRATGVRTAAGDVLEAATVVLASGSWTNELLAPFGRTLPFARVIASRLTTPDYGQAGIPTLMLPELSGLWVREHRGGLTYGSGVGYEALHVSDTPADRRPQRVDLIEAMRAELTPIISTLLPGAADAAEQTEWTQGVVSYTADRRFIAGAVPEVDGLFVVAGDNESGVTHGPGLGRLVAELIVSGVSDSTWDADEALYDPARFAPAQYADEKDVAAAMPARREVDATRTP